METQGCNPTIVSTFARVAHHTNFAYCFSIIGANQQLSHSEARSVSSHSLSGPYSRQISQSSSPSSTMPRQARQSNIDAGLDSYFPFDPYDLPRSEKWIGRIYRTWNEVAIEGETESDGLDEESEEESEDDDSSADDQPSVGISLPKRRVGSYSDARRRFLGKDGGLSSSLEGMNISPSLSGLVG